MGTTQPTHAAAQKANTRIHLLRIVWLDEAPIGGSTACATVAGALSDSACGMCRQQSTAEEMVSAKPGAGMMMLMSICRCTGRQPLWSGQAVHC